MDRKTALSPLHFFCRLFYFLSKARHCCFLLLSYFDSFLSFRMMNKNDDSNRQLVLVCLVLGLGLSLSYLVVSCLAFCCVAFHPTFCIVLSCRVLDCVLLRCATLRCVASY